MSTTVDARGLSCPQPVLMTMDEIKKGGDNEIIVLVDSDTSKENVSRAAKSQAWDIADIQEKEGGYRLTLKKELRN